MKEQLSYKKAGVDIDVADAVKKVMAKSLETADKRVLNKIGAFASLFDGTFPEYKHPVLVLKTEEPGSKQKLAFQYNRVSSICYDMINHLINDIIAMGAKPLSVQDAIIDGSKIEEGDSVLAVASNGLHTNGYSLVRALMAQKPEIIKMQVEGESFLEAILKPHKCYYQSFRGLFNLPEIHGIAHITGGGIEGNLNRILPEALNVVIDLGKIEVLPIFKILKKMGGVEESDMMRTFNMGVGMTIVVKKTALKAVRKHLSEKGCSSYVIGEISKGKKKVVYQGKLNW